MDNLGKINTMSPLTWAYIGDAVYELHIRNYLIETTNLKPNKLHKEAIKYVKAGAQAQILEKDTASTLPSPPLTIPQTSPITSLQILANLTLFLRTLIASLAPLIF